MLLEDVSKTSQFMRLGFHVNSSGIHGLAAMESYLTVRLKLRTQWATGAPTEAAIDYCSFSGDHQYDRGWVGYKQVVVYEKLPFLLRFGTRSKNKNRPYDKAILLL